MSNIGYKIRKYEHKLSIKNVPEKDYLYKMKLRNYLHKKNNFNFNFIGGMIGGAIDDYNLLAFIYNFTGNNKIKEILNKQIDKYTTSGYAKLTPDETKALEDAVPKEADKYEIPLKNVGLGEKDILEITNQLLKSKGKIDNPVNYLKITKQIKEQYDNKSNELQKEQPKEQPKEQSQQKENIITKILNKDDKKKNELEKQAKENAEKLKTLFSNIQKFIDELKKTGCTKKESVEVIQKEVETIREIVGVQCPKIQAFEINLDFDCEGDEDEEEDEASRALNLIFQTQVKEPLKKFNEENKDYVEKYNSYINEQNKLIESQMK